MWSGRTWRTVLPGTKASPHHWPALPLAPDDQGQGTAGRLWTGHLHHPQSHHTPKYLLMLCAPGSLFRDEGTEGRHCTKDTAEGPVPSSLAPQAMLRDLTGRIPESPSSMSPVPNPSLSRLPGLSTMLHPEHTPRALAPNSERLSPSCGTASSRPSPAHHPTSRGSACSASAGRWGGPACPSN